MNIPVATPQMIKDVRQALGVSQAKLGQLLDVSVCTINLWETGKHPIGSPNVVGLALQHLLVLRRHEDARVLACSVSMEPLRSELER